MLYAGKEIKKLSNDELKNAILTIVGIDKNRLDQLEAARPRHKKIFDKHPPIENPAFAQLAEELNKEYNKRNLKNLVAWS